MSSDFSAGYLLGIGSNLSPYPHIGKIMAALIAHFPTIAVSRVLSIPPIGMNSQYDFLNLVAYIETDWEQTQLKAVCNQIETTLGRDRNDPDRKAKDRTADLDILLHLQTSDDFSLAANQITDEYFLYPLIDELFAYLSHRPNTLHQTGVIIQHDGLTFGEAATTINRNATSG